MNIVLRAKPAHAGIIFEKYISELSATMRFRSLDIKKDLELINTWVNKSYAKKFWQLDGDDEMLENIYSAVLENPAAHSFIGELDAKAFCQVDMYSIVIDELREHVNAKESDAGFHLLMCPPREMQKGWSYYAVSCVQEYFFSMNDDGDLYCEPDQNNYHANRLAINTRFRFLKTITLSYKTANLYCITRDQFFKRG